MQDRHVHPTETLVEPGCIRAAASQLERSFEHRKPCGHLGQRTRLSERFSPETTKFVELTIVIPPALDSGAAWLRIGDGEQPAYTLTR